jgi:hypothetical protein
MIIASSTLLKAEPPSPSIQKINGSHGRKATACAYLAAAVSLLSRFLLVLGYD